MIAQGDRTDLPLVSVVMPVCNSAQSIARPLESIARQNYNHLDVIVIDDASTDETLDLVRRNRSIPSLRVIALQKNQGAASARNRGLAEAQGEFVAFLDSDDEWLPDKTRAQVEALIENPNAVMCTCNSERVSATGNTVMRTFAHLPPHAGAGAWQTLLKYNFIPTPTVLARTAALREAGGFHEELKVGEDLDLWIRLASRAEIAVIPAVYTRFHESISGLSATYARRSNEIVLPMLRGHLDRLMPEIGRYDAERIWSDRLFRTALEMYSLGRTTEASFFFRRTLMSGPRRLRSLALLVMCLLPKRLREGSIRQPGEPV